MAQIIRKIIRNIMKRKGEKSIQPDRVSYPAAIVKKGFNSLDILSLIFMLLFSGIDFFAPCIDFQKFLFSGFEF